MKTLTKIKIRRYLNRRSNGVVEQFEKMITRLQAWIDKLDAEQDAIHAEMELEIASIRAGAVAEQERLTFALAEAKANAEAAEVAATETFGAIFKEAASEASRAKQVQQNMQAIVGTPL